MKIKINKELHHNAPPSKLAEVELYLDGLHPMLDGLKIVDIGIWKSKTDDEGCHVTFPGRSYTNQIGEKKTFVFLRAIGDDPKAGKALKTAIIDAYKKS